MRIIYVKRNNKNFKLADYILKEFPLLSKSFLFKSLRNKNIRVNDKKVTQNIYVHENDKLEIYITDEILFNLPKKLNYVYTDKNIIVVFKPQGILSNNEDSSNIINEPTLNDLVKKDYNDAIICHRLDRNTAGLLMFARNIDALNEIKSASLKNKISKVYITYVYKANFKKDEDVLEKYIKTDKTNSFSKIYDTKIPNSKKIYTKYKVIYKNIEKDYAILKVIIHNGKTHQIRAQLANISHPIIGDSKYGINSVNKKFKKYKQLLFSCGYIFDFDFNSNLYYLNNISINIDEKFYKEYIGSEFYENSSKV